MILTKEQFNDKLKTLIGEAPSDDMISLLEDMTDTYNDLESRSSGESNEAWEKKYNELDASWRQRYTDRFFGKGTDVPPEPQGSGEPEDSGEDVHIDDLFIESEGK